MKDLRDLARLIQDPLNAAERSSLVRTLYNNTYNRTHGDVIEDILGNSLRRETESGIYFDGLRKLLNDYKLYSVKEHSGLNIIEYLKLTPHEAHLIVDFSKRVTIEYNEKLQEKIDVTEEGKNVRR